MGVATNQRTTPPQSARSGCQLPQRWSQGRFAPDWFHSTDSSVAEVSGGFYPPLGLRRQSRRRVDILVDPYRAGTNHQKYPRRMKLRGLCVYCGCVNQAISLTVMLTSGMASVELLTSISPERICSFTALYSSTVKCSMLQVSVGRPTYSPSSRPKLVTLPP